MDSIRTLVQGPFHRSTILFSDSDASSLHGDHHGPARNKREDNDNNGD